MVFREQRKREAAKQYKLSAIDEADLHVNYEEDNYDAGVRDAIEQFAPKAFIAGAEWADAHPKNPWISVKDRLPEPEQEVLLYDNSSIKYYEIGWLRKKKGYNESIWALCNGYVTDDSITHWMPIVEPK